MVDEKRKFTRVSFRAQAEMTCNDVLYGTGEVNNLSMGGCLLKINEDLAIGGDCQLSIFLNEESMELAIRVKGTILRSENGYVAVKFTNIDPYSLFHLKNIIRYNSIDLDTIEQEILDNPGIL